MILQDLKKILDGIDIMNCYGYFPDNQEPPYVCYFSTNSNPIFSDGIIVNSEESVTLNLVTVYRDLKAECYIDRALTRYGVQFSKNYEIDAEQKTHTVVYSFTV